MESAILILVAVGALGAFATGVVLLVLYVRSGQIAGGQQREPVVYGNLVQCPTCGYMNPLESAACLNCRNPLPRPRGYQPPPAQYPTYMSDQSGATPSASPTPSPQGYNSGPAPSYPPPQQAAASPAGSSAVPRPPGMPNAWLEGVSGAMQGQRMVLQSPDILIGRSTVCDVQVFDPKVSRKHVRIRYGNGAFFMQDQQSSRGTRVNGERVMAQKLNNGDRLGIGDTELVFRIEG